jgi:TatD DNase family protein
MFIDLHAHLDRCEDIEKAIENAKKNNVKIILASGIHPESNRKVIELTKKYDIVKAAIGLYPIDAFRTESYPEKYDVEIEEEIEFIRLNKDNIMAIGEIGLDYHTGDNKEEQKELFKKLLDLAVELNKPVIIHSRKAEADVLDILEEYKDKLKIINHCFSGKKKLVVRAKELGFYFTIPTNVVRSQQFQHMVENVPLSQLFCETDTPYLSPFKDQWNEPANVVESYKKIAEIKEMELEEVMNIVYNNWQKVFL